jgi:hypothetical protein
MKFGTIGAGAVALAFAREALARGQKPLPTFSEAVR